MPSRFGCRENYFLPSCLPPVSLSANAGANFLVVNFEGETALINSCPVKPLVGLLLLTDRYR